MGLNTLGLGIILSLRDGASIPAMRAAGALGQLDLAAATFSQSFNTAMATAFEGMNLLAAGVLTLGAPLAFIKSTLETQKAMAQVISSGVEIEYMDKMKKSAEDFTNTWAGSTQAQFFESMYDIKSGLYELSDAAVEKMTITTGILAKATKSSMLELQSLAPIMFGILKPTREGVSNIDFIDELAGGLSRAVKLYRLTGKEFGNAFSQTTAIASRQGLSMQQQLASLGMLGQTMTGSEAGTKLKAFAIGVPKAVPKMQKLGVKGLELSDKNGFMLPITDALENIRKKYGTKLTIASQEELRKMFGSREATSFIVNLLPYVDKLKKDAFLIKEAMNEGLPVAMEMALQASNSISDVWALIQQRVDNLSQKIGEKLIPVYGPFIVILGDIAVYLQKIIEAYPIIVQVAGAFALFIGSVLIAAGSIIILSAIFNIVNSALVLMSARLITLRSEIVLLMIRIWPVIAISGLLYLAFKSNFLGIADIFNLFIAGFVNLAKKISAIWRGLSELVGSMNGDVGRISNKTKKELENLGLWELTVKLFKVFTRLKYLFYGILDGFKIFIQALKVTLEPVAKDIVEKLKPIGKVLEFLGIGGFNELVEDLMKPTQSNADTWYKIGLAFGLIAGAFLSVKMISAFLWVFSKIAFVARGLYTIFSFLYPIIVAIVTAIGTAIIYILGLFGIFIGASALAVGAVALLIAGVIIAIYVYRKEIYDFFEWFIIKIAYYINRITEFFRKALESPWEAAKLAAYLALDFISAGVNATNFLVNKLIEATNKVTGSKFTTFDYIARVDYSDLENKFFDGGAEEKKKKEEEKNKKPINFKSDDAIFRMGGAAERIFKLQTTNQIVVPVFLDGKQVTKSVANSVDQWNRR